MFVIKELDLLVKVASIPEEERSDLTGWFERRKNCGLLEMEDGRFITADMLKEGAEPTMLRVPYGPDMFYEGRLLGSRYAVAVNEADEPVCVLEWLNTPYLHEYVYSGTLDMRLLDNFDCIFLYDCNEYSTELVRRVLPLWQGKRLIMLGPAWDGLIPMLPDLDNLECFYRRQLSEEDYGRLSSGLHCLHVVVGRPHRESMRRWENGVLIYDEVMSFTFLFSNRQELGPLNPDKKFFLVNASYDTLGLFALCAKAEAVARYAKSSGWIPVMNLVCNGMSLYQEYPSDNIWTKFYRQPEGFSLEEVMRSKNVYNPPMFYNGDIQTNIMDMFSGSTDLAWPDGVYSPAAEAYFKEREKKFLPCPEKTLGVLVRGTDYTVLHLLNHPIHATPEMVFEKIDEVWDQWGGFEWIFLATEDAHICQRFKERYGDRLTCTDQLRYTIEPGETWEEFEKMRYEMQKKQGGFLMGVEYMLAIHLLSQCRCLLASGGCGGVTEALEQNGGKYEHTFVFDLGEWT